MEVLRRSKDHLERILDEAKIKLGETTYLVGNEFTLADHVHTYSKSTSSPEVGREIHQDPTKHGRELVCVVRKTKL